MRKATSRLIALLLAFVMILGTIPITAIAEEVVDPTEPAATEAPAATEPQVTVPVTEPLVTVPETTDPSEDPSEEPTEALYMRK